MYPTFLEALRLGGPRTGDLSEWLEIMARYVAADSDFKGREDWRRGALDLAKEHIGPSASVAEKIENAFASQYPTNPLLLDELMQRGADLFQADRFTEAEEVFREALVMRPDHLRARWLLGASLFFSEKDEDAIVALEHLVDQLSPDDSLESRTVIVFGLVCKIIAFCSLGRLEAAAQDLERVSGYVDPREPAEDLRDFAAMAYDHYGLELADSGRLEESIAALRRVTDYVRPDDSSELRHIAARALLTKGEILSKLESQSEAMGAWDQVTEYVRIEDPVKLRNVAVYALNNKTRRDVPSGNRREMRRRAASTAGSR